jgi:outer membrane protein assembly factor BamD
MFLGLIVLGCAEIKPSANMTADRKMQIADDFFQKEKYHKAVPFYSDLVFERNSIFTAEAQIKLANCYFSQNKFMEARFEYDELMRLFPDSEYAEYAQFQVGVCYFNEAQTAQYTQEETKMSIAIFDSFFEKFPYSEYTKDAIDYIRKCQYRLLKKKYHNGYIYFKLFDYSSALMYFDEIIELGNNDNLDKMSRYYKILISHKREEDVTQMTNSFLGKYPKSKEAGKIIKNIK